MEQNWLCWQILKQRVNFFLFQWLCKSFGVNLLNFSIFSGSGLIDLLGGFFEFVVADLSVVIEVGAFDALQKKNGTENKKWYCKKYLEGKVGFEPA